MRIANTEVCRPMARLRSFAYRDLKEKLNRFYLINSHEWLFSQSCQMFVVPFSINSNARLALAFLSLQRCLGKGGRCQPFLKRAQMFSFWARPWLAWFGEQTQVLEDCWKAYSPNLCSYIPKPVVVVSAPSMTVEEVIEGLADLERVLRFLSISLVGFYGMWKQRGGGALQLFCSQEKTRSFPATTHTRFLQKGKGKKLCSL